jgi:CRISPR-associated protein Cmx8
MLVDYTRRFPLPDGAVLEAVHRDDVRFDLRLNQAGLGALFDRVYRAGLEEIAVAKPWINKRTKQEVPPKRTDVRQETDKKGQTKEVTVSIYDVVVPHGGPLGDWSPPDDGGVWLKLWRDWLWNTLRAIPKQRLAYQQRAGIAASPDDDDDGEEGGGSKDVATAWAQLTGDNSVKQASTYCLGAMDVNAEGVPFLDRGRFLFLLHFWPFAVHIFVPQYIDASGDRKQDGFATCIPDVARLDRFVRKHIEAFQKRRADVGGFRPRQGLIDLPDAAALEVEQWFEAAIAKGVDQDDAPATAGFQVIHAAKEGNSVRIRSNRMVTPTRDQRQHAKVVHDLWAHLTRRQVLANILDGKRWWVGFDRVCATWSKDRTIHDKSFRHDARTLFEHYHPEDRTMSDTPTTNAKPSNSIELLVLKIVQGWLRGRMQAKHEIDMKTIWSLPKDDPRREDAEKKNGKLATEAFLAARSRPGKEFSRWFTATLCSVNHYLPEADFVTVARALDESPEQVRSLTLLALSARG